jgi:ligand-binding SRPBCC domain-containing protein
MAKSGKTIAINAPVEKVFSYIDEPTNLLEIWPSIVEVKDVQRLPNGGTKFRFVYKLLGMRFEGTSEDIERVANQHVVTKTKGGIESTQTWTFQPEAGGTKLTWQMEYTMPIPALGKLAEALAIEMNERELELVLANLKDRMEA